MVKHTFESRDGTITCDKRDRPGETPELICRRCLRSVCSVVNAKRGKWLDAADVHAKEQCTPPQGSWQYRPIARAIEAPELRGLVFVARGCVDTEMCAAAVGEVKQFAEKSWTSSIRGKTLCFVTRIRLSRLSSPSLRCQHRRLTSG